MKLFTHKPLHSDVIEQMTLLASALRPNATMRRCFNCGEGFKPTNRYHVACSRTCSRTLHYLKFNLRLDLPSAFPPIPRKKVKR